VKGSLNFLSPKGGCCPPRKEATNHSILHEGKKGNKRASFYDKLTEASRKNPRISRKRKEKGNPSEGLAKMTKKGEKNASLSV